MGDSTRWTSTTTSSRVDNYIVGKNRIALVTNSEINIGREETLEALREILKKDGKTAHEIVTRFGMSLTANQADKLRLWLERIKVKAG